MLTYNNIRFIGVDHGYGNIKTANTVTPTGIIVSDTEPTFKNKLLYYRNRYYNFGEGHKDFISDKTADDEYYAATLMGIAEELRLEGLTEADVHICAGLPLTWVSSQREDFRSYLTKHEEVIFTYRDKTIEEIHELESLKYIEDNGVKVKGDLFDIGWKKSGLIQKREKYADKYDRAKQEMEDSEKQEKYYREIMYDKFSEMVKLIRQKEEDERLMQEYDRKMYQAAQRKQRRDTWSPGGR